MTIRARLKRLEVIENFAKPVRQIMFVCDELPTDAYQLTNGEHMELIERNQGEDQDTFNQRAYAVMESYERDNNAPVAFLYPVVNGDSHDAE